MRAAAWGGLAWFLAAALCLAPGCGSDGAGGDGAGGDGGHAEPDLWQVDSEGLSAGLFAVTGDDEGVLWAVGADDGQGPLVLQHPHGKAGEWTRVDTKAFPGDLWWSCGPDAATRYLVGSAGRVLKWSGGSFAAMPTPTQRILYGCWAADTSHIWAVGGDPKGVEDGVVLLSDGATWTEVTDLPAAPKGTSFFKVWGTSATDVRVIGTAGYVAHWDGKTWTREELGTTNRLITLHGTADLQVIVGGTGNGAVYERTNAAWTERSPEAIQALNGVFLRGDKAYAVGFRGTLIDRTDTGWELRDETPTDLDLHGVFIDKTGTAWAVGGNLFSQPASDGVILRR